jgi:hypothetical protein
MSQGNSRLKCLTFEVIASCCDKLSEVPAQAFSRGYSAMKINVPGTTSTTFRSNTQVELALGSVFINHRITIQKLIRFKGWSTVWARTMFLSQDMERMAIRISNIQKILRKLCDI